MSADNITIRRELLSLFPDALHKGILIALIERADRNGVVELSVNAFAKEIGANRMMVARMIDRLTACNIVNKLTNNSPNKFASKLIFCNRIGNKIPPTSECSTMCASSRASGCADGEGEKKTTSTRFIKPTVEEIAAYCKEKGYRIDAQYFWNHYESVGWMRGKTKMKSWKMTLATWNSNNHDKRTIQTEDKYDPRRGTGVGDVSETDYYGSF